LGGVARRNSDKEDVELSPVWDFWICNLELLGLPAGALEDLDVSGRLSGLVVRKNSASSEVGVLGALCERDSVDCYK